jgi:ribonuclease BN (tRNA processing enzyme)
MKYEKIYSNTMFLNYRHKLKNIKRIMRRIRSGWKGRASSGWRPLATRSWSEAVVSALLGGTRGLLSWMLYGRGALVSRLHPNDLLHHKLDRIFCNPTHAHHLEGLLASFGGNRQEALLATHRAVRQVLRQKWHTVGAFMEIVVNGFRIEVTANVVNGFVRIDLHMHRTF